MSRIFALLAIAALLPIPAFGDVPVRGYTRHNGTVVQPYMRTDPNSTKNDNYSTRGNVNPRTGTPGTKSGDYNSTPQRNGIQIADSEQAPNPQEINASHDTAKLQQGLNGGVRNTQNSPDSIDVAWAHNHPELQEKWQARFPGYAFASLDATPNTREAIQVGYLASIPEWARTPSPPLLASPSEKITIATGGVSKEYLVLYLPHRLEKGLPRGLSISHGFDSDLYIVHGHWGEYYVGRKIGAEKFQSQYFRVAAVRRDSHSSKEKNKLK